MKQWVSKTSFSVTILIASFLVVCYQACNLPGSSQNGDISGGGSELNSGGNGDFYSGISESLSAFSKGLAGELKVVEHQDSPPLPGQCPRPEEALCSEKTRKTIFDGCNAAPSNSQLFGVMQLNYSSENCAMDSLGDSVGVYYGLLFITPQYFQVSISTAEHSDYREVLIGGGAVQYSNLNLGVSIFSPGTHTVVKGPLGTVLSDRSRRNLKETVVEIDEANKRKTVNQGTIEEINNLTRSTATYTINQLVYQEGCCHPVAGSVEVKQDGVFDWLAKVEFAGCGNARLIPIAPADSSQIDLQLSSCESIQE